MILTITSLTHPLIKKIVRLHTARERKTTGLCIIEGRRALETALTRLSPDQLYCTEQHIAAMSQLIDPSQIIQVSDAVMKKISTAITPSGILGVFHIPPEPDPTTLMPGLVLAQVSDPGNMGTLIRTVAACALSSVIIVEGVDPWSPKVIQASAGTIALVDIFQWDWHTVVASKKRMQLYGLVVTGGKTTHAIDRHNALLVVGNEARGIDERWLKDCDSLITLPMPGGTESLNAAVAGSIALYEIFVHTQYHARIT